MTGAMTPRRILIVDDEDDIREVARVDLWSSSATGRC